MVSKVVFRWGRECKETTLKVGQRLLAAGYMLGYDEIGFGDCGGNLTCGTCHVKLLKGQFAPPKREEREMLDSFPQVFAESRMACQLLVGEDTGEIEVEWMG